MNQENKPRNYKYFAFISYSSRDTRWGRRLQRKLENYSMPTTLCKERGWKHKPMNPVFFAPTDIQPGGLTEELQDRAVAGSIEKLKKYGMFDPSKVMFISFYIRQCNLLAKAAPGFTVQYLGKDQSVDGLLDNMVNGIDAHYDYLLNTPDYLKMARQHGFSVNVWTVNDAENMEKVLELGIDYLTTDHPDVARKVLEENNIPELLQPWRPKEAVGPHKKLKKQLSAGDYVLCYAGKKRPVFWWK